MVAAALVPAAASADQWALEGSVESSFGTNSNINLEPNSPGTVNSMTLSTTLNAARRQENAATLVNINLSAVGQKGPGSANHFDGLLGITQSLAFARTNIAFGASAVQDYNNNVRTANIGVGPGQRRTANLSAGGSYAVTERFNVNAQLAWTEVAFAVPTEIQASDYRDSSLSVGVAYLVTESDSVTAQVSQYDYRTTNGSNRTTSDGFTFGLSHAFSETSSASLSVGPYRTVASQQVQKLVCPLPANYCSSGLVPWVVVNETVQTAGNGRQFSVSLGQQFNETTSMSFAVGQQLAPSGAGAVLPTDTVSFIVNHGFSPTLTGSVNYYASRGNGTGAQPAQSALSLSLSKQLSPDLSLQAAYQHSDALNLAGSSNAHSNSFNVSLRYALSKLERSH